MLLRSTTNRMALLLLLGFGIGMFNVPRSPAEPLTEHLATALAENYHKRRPAIAPPTSLSNKQAQLIQAEFIQELMPSMGPVVGYKAALTNPKAQERFQSNQPLLGELLEKMLLPSGSKIPVKFGTRSLIEGDLMVRVGGDDINQATSHPEILAALEAVIPFVELPDLVYASPKGLTPSALMAVNVGARLGVMGEAIPITESGRLTPEQAAAWATSLAKLRVELINPTGEVIGTGKGSALLGHPLEAVRWVRDELHRQGRSLKSGDLISLGTITPLMPVQPGLYKVRYMGLLGTDEQTDNTIEVWMEFKP